MRLFKKSLDFKKVKRIEHIGSTAIKDIKSKNIIDILIELNKEYNVNDLKSEIVSLGLYNNE